MFDEELELVEVRADVDDAEEEVEVVDACVEEDCVVLEEGIAVEEEEDAWVDVREAGVVEPRNVHTPLVPRGIYAIQ